MPAEASSRRDLAARGTCALSAANRRQECDRICTATHDCRAEVAPLSGRRCSAQRGRGQHRLSNAPPLTSSGRAGMDDWRYIEHPPESAWSGRRRSLAVCRHAADSLADRADVLRSVARRCPSHGRRSGPRCEGRAPRNAVDKIVTEQTCTREFRRPCQRRRRGSAERGGAARMWSRTGSSSVGQGPDVVRASGPRTVARGGPRRGREAPRPAARGRPR